MLEEAQTGPAAAEPGEAGMEGAFTCKHIWLLFPVTPISCWEPGKPHTEQNPVGFGCCALDAEPPVSPGHRADMGVSLG